MLTAHHRLAAERTRDTLIAVNRAFVGGDGATAYLRDLSALIQ